MPQFVIERQYLVPMNQHIVVEAESFEEACDMAMSDDISWDSQEMDCDNARATTLTDAKAIPEG
ncbi:MAG: hypothetical protein WB611_28985 [Stellaceae bacterium]